MNTQLKTALLALFLLPAAAAACHAQSDDSAAAGGFNLKHRSSFNSTAARNPFWPIGWVKTDTGENETQEVALITPSQFDITSISTGQNPLAVINGKTYGEGETITALYGSQKIKILVLAINDGEVVLQYLDKKYTIPLRRPEFVLHTSTADDDELSKKDSNILILRP